MRELDGCHFRVSGQGWRESGSGHYEIVMAAAAQTWALPSDQTRQLDVIVAGLGAHGSSAAYRLAARGCVGPRVRSFRARAHARIVRRTLADHSALLLRAPRLRAAAPPRMDAVARARGRERRDAPHRDGRPLRRRSDTASIVSGALQKRATHELDHEVLDAADAPRALPAVRMAGRLARRVRAAGRMARAGALHRDAPAARGKRRARRCGSTSRSSAGSRRAKACASRPRRARSRQSSS